MNDLNEFPKRYLPFSVENTDVLFVLFVDPPGTVFNSLHCKKIWIYNSEVYVCQYAYSKRLSSYLVPVGHTVLRLFRASWYL